MSTISKDNQQLMRTVYIERLGELVPNLLKWFECKEAQVEQFHKINREILFSLQRFSEITNKYLQYLLSFLSDEKTTARKLAEIKQNHSFLKTLEKQKLKKTSEEDQKAIADLKEWNPTLLKFFDGLSQSTIEQREMLKKFYHSLQQLIDQFEKIQENYKVFMKKHFKQCLKKLEDIEDSSKIQKKILSKYYDQNKKYSKDAVATISDVKLVEYSTHKQIMLMTSRSMYIKAFIEEMIQYETMINNAFKERFGVFVSGEETIFKLTNRMMALPKLIERIDSEQVSIKTRYFQKNIVTEPTLAKIKTFCGFLQSDSLASVYKYLSISIAGLTHMFDVQKAMKEFVDHVVFRQWQVELSEGWIIQSWTKCKGYITLDNVFILFGEDSKAIRVINTRNTKLQSKQQSVVFLNESQKGIFGTSSQEYKIRFGSKDQLQQFQLYLNNKIS